MPRFPGNLESQYSKAFGRFIDEINREYIKVLRALLKEGDETFNNNSSLVVNAFNYRKFRDRLQTIREKISRKRIRKKIFLEMDNVMRGISAVVVDGIEEKFREKRFPIPTLELQAPSAVLEQAVILNVDLIGAIEDKQVNELEQAVMSAVTGGSNFDFVIEEVERQSNRGRAYAEFVARDQVGKTFASINAEKSQRAGFPGYIWNATNDDRTRPDHLLQDGKFFRWDSPPKLNNGALHPGEDFQCRCVAEPSFDPRPNQVGALTPFDPLGKRTVSVA